MGAAARPSAVTTPEQEGFLRRAHDRLWPAVAAFCGPAQADDAVAEAMAYAWEHWDQLSAMRNPMGYLYRVAQSAAAREGRQAQRFLPAVGPRSIYDSPVDPELPAALELLTEHQRVAVVLHIGLGWTLDEVAEVLAVSKSTVRNHVRRALTSLRRTLHEAAD